MGKFGDSVQDVQLLQGRQDTRRSMAQIERNINQYLLSCYLTKDLVLGPSDLGRYGLDIRILNLVYGDFREVHVGEDMVRVVY